MVIEVQNTKTGFLNLKRWDSENMFTMKVHKGIFKYHLKFLRTNRNFNEPESLWGSLSGIANKITMGGGRIFLIRE